MALTQAQVEALQSAAHSPAEYGDGTDSTVGEQFNLQSWIKEALIEEAPKQWFGQTASVINAPKHMGKKLVRYLYLPLLDDRNINDQGIDAAGVKIANGNLYGSSRDINTILEFQPTLTEYGGEVNRISFTRIKLEGTYEEFGFQYVYTLDQLQFDTDAQLRQHNVREAMRGATKIMEDRLQVDLLLAANTIMYGGNATQRTELTGYEDVAANVMPSIISYKGFVNAGLLLDDLDAPTDTKVVKGSTYEDTKTISEARLLYVGTPIINQLLQLKDYHNNAAYVEVKHYAASGNIALGEHGSIANFRVIKVGKDMTYWKGAGAEVVGNDNNGYFSDVVNGTERFNVYPMVCIPSETYTTISFKNGKGGTNKFEYFDQAPKQKIRTLDDAFGKVGFATLSWWYGFMVLRAERLLRFEVVCKM